MRRAVLVGLVCLIGAPLAMADLKVQYVTVEDATTVTVDSSFGKATSVSAGLYQLNIKGSDADKLGISGTRVDAFCIDLADQASSSWQSYTAKDLKDAPDKWAGPMGEKRAQYLATLLDTYWTDWSQTGNKLTGIKNTYTDKQAAGALQLAIWEIVDEFNTDYDGTDGEKIKEKQWDVTKGVFTASGDSKIITLANSMLKYIAGLADSELSSTANYIAVSNGLNDCTGYGYQDYVVRVPLPGAVLLGMLGLGAAGLRLRRRREV